MRGKRKRKQRSISVQIVQWNIAVVAIQSVTSDVRLAEIRLDRDKMLTLYAQTD